VQYTTQVNFDADEVWRVHLLVHSATGGGEAYATVEATPPGLRRWGLLFFAAPFLGAGFLWFRAATRKRKHRKRGGRFPEEAALSGLAAVLIAAGE
jgi:hypothetical protein